jgi:DNA-directed RNA polymerase subunit RPC12/RpoP
MIRVALPDIIVVYLVAILTVLFAIWLGTEILRMRREKRSRQHQVSCTICGMRYEDRSLDPLPRCPVCSSVNERRKIREI